jgi:hypothetical protein
MDLWTREARLFKYGSGTGSNFSKLRGDNEPSQRRRKISGLMSFLKIGDRAAGAIKSGGTTRRAAKMVCLDLDHPDVEQFINWKVREELKVAAMAEGIKHLPKAQRDLAAKLGLKLDYDFNGEAYMTVSGQNSNNSVRIPNRFFKAVEDDGDWNLTYRTKPKSRQDAQGPRSVGADRLRRLALRRPGRSVRRHHQPVAHLPAERPDQGLQPLRHRRHARPDARRNLAADRPDDPPPQPGRHQSHQQDDSRHRRRVPDRQAGSLRAAHRRRIQFETDGRPSRSGRAIAAGSPRGIEPPRRSALPSAPATVQEIGEPQDPHFLPASGACSSPKPMPASRFHPASMPASARPDQNRSSATSPAWRRAQIMATITSINDAHRPCSTETDEGRRRHPHRRAPIAGSQPA